MTELELAAWDAIWQRWYDRGVTWCHLVTDSPDLEELHLFAESIGLRRAYFQNKHNRPHYDVTAPKRVEAVAAGAVEIDIRQNREIRLRREAALTDRGVS